MLLVENLSVRYGPLEAVRGVSFALKEGEALAVIGPNGAGKTSLSGGFSASPAPKGGFSGRGPGSFPNP
jgi:ABC-type branched-subunit amino acid transport system ATPase component